MPPYESAVCSTPWNVRAQPTVGALCPQKWRSIAIPSRIRR